MAALHCDGSVLEVVTMELSPTEGRSSPTTPYSAWTEIEMKQLLKQLQPNYLNHKGTIILTIATCILTFNAVFYLRKFSQHSSRQAFNTFFFGVAT